MTRRTWYAIRLSDDEDSIAFAGVADGSSVVFVADDNNRVAAIGFAFEDGMIRGVRLDDRGGIWDITASDVESLLLGIRDAFRADARDTSAEVN